MLSEPDVLILDEPTRGIDVGAKFEIYTIINELAALGKGIVMISSEMAELLGASDRIVVMCRGQVTGTVDARTADQPTIMRLATNVGGRRGRSRWRSMADPAGARDRGVRGLAAAVSGASGSTATGLREWVASNAIILVLVALIVGIAVIDSGFVSLTNLRNILLNSSTRLIIALGAGIVLISRGVDLSAGRMVGLAAVVSASMLQVEDYSRRFFPDLVPLPLFVPILIAIALCVLMGAINGVVVARLRVPPFIATLGMMVIVYGDERDLLRSAAEQQPADRRVARRLHGPWDRRRRELVRCRSRTSSSWRP